MKIAIFSDIHGNSVALEAVLKEVRQLNIEHVFVLGDFVGYYYHPELVLEMLTEFRPTMIHGNHEVMLKEVLEDPQKGEEVRAQFGNGISLALERLSHEQVEMLTHLPPTANVTLDGMRFLLCHGTPWDNDEYVYPDASREVLEKCASQDADVVLLGHTHYPFVYSGKGAVVLNPGSVGQPRDRGGRGKLASWAVVDTANASIVLKRTAFDVAQVIAEAQTHDPEVRYLQEVFER